MSQDLKQYVGIVMVPQDKRIMAYDMEEAERRVKATMTVYPKGSYLLRIDEDPTWTSMFEPTPQIPRGA